MIQYLLGKSDISALFRLVSADFLKVVPLPSTLSLIGKLTANSQASEEWEQTKSKLKKTLGISIATPAADPAAPPLTQAEGQEVLTLYFLQILSSDTWILDFRRQSFQRDPWSWTPQAYYLETSPSYAAAIRDLYAGFYKEDESRFVQALEVLQLTPARAALEEHFGIQSQNAIRFELQTFQMTFAKIFQLCAAAQCRLHPEFAVLGILLLTLYENLEPTGLSFDVRAAYFAAEKRALELRAPAS